MRSRIAPGSGDAAIRILAMGAFEGLAGCGKPASHLLDVLLVEDFLHGQQLEDPTRSLVERRAFLLGIAGVAEGDEEAPLTPDLALALDDGFERVDCGLRGFMSGGRTGSAPRGFDLGGGEEGEPGALVLEQRLDRPFEFAGGPSEED